MDARHGFSSIAVLVIWLAAPVTSAQSWAWVEQAGGSRSSTGESIAVDGRGSLYITGGFRGSAAFGSVTLTGEGFEDVFVAKYATDGSMRWVRRAGGTGNLREMGTAIATGPDGSAYVTGLFAGKAEFENIRGRPSITLASAGESDVFVARYSANGALLWAQRAGGTDFDAGLGIAVGADGSAYITGYVDGNATFGSTPIQGGAARDYFVAQYAANGDVGWVQRNLGEGNSAGQAIAVDASGAVYATGLFLKRGFFGTVPLTSTGSWDLIVAKYTPGGDMLWVRQAGASGSLIEGLGIAVGADGSPYVTGKYQGRATFGHITLPASFDYDVFVARYTTEGGVLWVQRGGGDRDDTGLGIAVSADGSVFTTGHFQDVATFSGVSLPAAAREDVFVLQYAPSGEVLQAKRAGGTSLDTGKGIAVDADGLVYVTGEFTGTAAFDGLLRTSGGGTADIFVAQLTGTTVSVEEEPAQPGQPLLLGPLSPQPASTRVEATLRAQTSLPHVRVDVLDALGRRVATVYEGALEAGDGQHLHVDASRLPPGIYVLRVAGREGGIVRPFVIMR